MFGRRKRSTEDFQEEVEAHLRMESDELKDEGVADAELAARRAFGNVAAYEERFYERGRWMWLDEVVQDTRFGMRQLRKSPGFTLAAALTLALGIGVNATVFTWFKTVVFNPIPGVNADNLVSVRWRSPQGGGRSFSWPDFVEVRKRNQSLSGLAAGRMAAWSLGSNESPQRVWGMLVSANYFDVLGIRPVRGRGFTADEDSGPGTHPVAIISYELWKTNFSGDEGIIGRQISLNRNPFTVVGVTPEGFHGSTPALRMDLWAPAMMQPVVLGGVGSLDQRGQRWLESVARLKPGVPAAQAEAELTAVEAQLASEFPDGEVMRAVITPVWKEGGGRVLAPVMMLMMTVVGVVMLIACANLSNLLLARSAARSREIAIRLAMGVTRGRLVRLLLVENSLIAAIGCAAALAAVPAASGLLDLFVPATDMPVRLTARPDATVMLFGLGVTGLATLLFGLLPALRASKPQIVDTLKDDSAGATGSRRTWLRSSLVVVQVALSLVLLIAAGLLLKSLDRARNADPGFDPRNVLVSGIELVPNGYDEARGKVALRQMLAKIAGLPGVAAVSTIRRLPLGLGGTSSGNFEVEGYTPSKGEELMMYTNRVGADYFHTMNTPLVAGRDFTPADTAQTQKVMVVNQTFANRYLAKGNPIGQRVRTNGEWVTVVGVAKDSKFQRLDEPAAPAGYFPVEQAFASEVNFLVRTSGDPMTMARPVEAAIHEIDSSLPIFAVRALEDSISVSFFGQRMGGSLLSFFAALALGLAAVGMYAVLAYSVAQRSREMGIRMALGASRAGVLAMVLANGLKLAGIGILVGLGLALAVTRLMTALLFDVSPMDAPTIAAVSGLLLAVTGAASLLPARRATRIDPISAIRRS